MKPYTLLLLVLLVGCGETRAQRVPLKFFPGQKVRLIIADSAGNTRAYTTILKKETTWNSRQWVEERKWEPEDNRFIFILRQWSLKHGYDGIAHGGKYLMPIYGYDMTHIYYRGRP